MRPPLTRSSSWAGSWADPISSPFSTKIHPALTSFGDEVCATVARLFAYVGTLALIAILAVHFWDQLPEIAALEDAPKPGWTVADRSLPAFALGSIDPDEKPVAYATFQHATGGRKDIFRWTAGGERPVAELEIYRPGGEVYSALPAPADLALRMPAGGDLEAAGVIDSKFGMVGLLRRSNGRDGAGGCLGFFKEVADPFLRISGWTCRGDNLPARRASIACMLDRLTLLGGGNEPKMIELFSRAGSGHRSCGNFAGSAAADDWITEADNPHLRGAL